MLCFEEKSFYILMIKKIKIIIIGNFLSNKLNLMNKVILCTICKT